MAWFLSTESQVYQTSSIPPPSAVDFFKYYLFIFLQYHFIVQVDFKHTYSPDWPLTHSDPPASPSEGCDHSECHHTCLLQQRWAQSWSSGRAEAGFAHGAGSFCSCPPQEGSRVGGAGGFALHSTGPTLISPLGAKQTLAAALLSSGLPFPGSRCSVPTCRNDVIFRATAFLPASGISKWGSESTRQPARGASLWGWLMGVRYL